MFEHPLEKNTNAHNELTDEFRIPAADKRVMASLCKYAFPAAVKGVAVLQESYPDDKKLQDQVLLDEWDRVNSYASLARKYTDIDLPLPTAAAIPKHRRHNIEAFSLSDKERNAMTADLKNYERSFSRYDYKHQTLRRSDMPEHREVMRLLLKEKDPLKKADMLGALYKVSEHEMIATEQKKNSLEIQQLVLIKKAALRLKALHKTTAKELMDSGLDIGPERAYLIADQLTKMTTHLHEKAGVDKGKNLSEDEMDALLLGQSHTTESNEPRGIDAVPVEQIKNPYFRVMARAYIENHTDVSLDLAAKSQAVFAAKEALEPENKARDSFQQDLQTQMVRAEMAAMPLRANLKQPQSVKPDQALSYILADAAFRSQRN